jgi:N-acetylneuraminic acid mutarotase
MNEQVACAGFFANPPKGALRVAFAAESRGTEPIPLDSDENPAIIPLFPLEDGRSLRFSKKASLVLALLFTALSVVKAQDLNQGLIAYYPFEGGAFDASGNGHHGTVAGANLATSRSGVPDSAYSFNGSSSHIILPASLAQLLAGIGPISISCWFRGPTPPGPSWKSLLAIGGKEADRALITGISPDGSFFYSQWGSTYNLIADQAYGDDTWHHQAVVIDGSQLSLFLDGVIRGQRTVASDRLNQHVLIGAPLDFVSAGFWDGEIDDVRFYNRALSVAEVSLLYTQADKGGIPRRAGHVAAAFGSEMIVWGGTSDITGANASDIGFIYNPVSDNWRLINDSGAPSARVFVTSGTTRQHTWTGTELIVWGGTDLMTRFGEGARYTPSNDTWASIATASAPEARDHHIMLWTGREVLVWGGHAVNGGSTLNSGARYNPTTDAWTTMSTENAPSARASFNGVWTGAEMIVFGGTSAINTGGRYNPATDTWTSISTDGAPGLQDHVAVWTGTEMIVWGGYQWNGLSAVGARYNPATDTWATLPSSPMSARRRHAAVWTGTEIIVWAGGGDSPAEGAGVGAGAAYNPTLNTWRSINNIGAPMARIDNTAVWTGMEMIVFGGSTGIPRVGGTVLSSGGRYNPITDSWQAISETVVSVTSPIVTVQPTQQMTKAGDPVTFSVEAIIRGPKPATATGQVNNGFLTQVDVLDGGGGYVEVPVVNVIDTMGSGAVLAASLSSSGEVSGVTVVIPGSGYSADPTITIDPPPIPEFHYQWRKDGVNIPGANASSLSISSPASSDIGDYTVLVSLPGEGQALSAVASLSVNVFTVDIADQFVHSGNNVVLAPTIMGVSSPAYQWKKDGNNIPNANSATLTLNGVALLDAGKFSLTITDAFTTQTTAMANLSVSDFSMAPVISITGKIGDVFRIEKADALLGTSQWNFVRDLTLSESPTAWVDLENPLPDKKFYRITPLASP